MLVTKEQAIKLRKWGFNEEVYNVYEFESDNLSKAIPNSYLHHKNFISAPTVSQALDFMREEKGIVCYVGMPHFQIRGDNRRYMKEYKGVIVISLIENYIGIGRFDTHSEAELALLEAVIKYVEENEKTKCK